MILSTNPTNRNESSKHYGRHGRAVSIWMNLGLIARLDTAIKRNRLPSRSFVISEAIFQYLDGLESLEQAVNGSQGAIHG